MSMTSKIKIDNRFVGCGTPTVLPTRQGGAVLLIALVVLVAMTLSALALIRSVNMTNLISGNLAFRESALLSSERSTEIALAWLTTNSATGNTTLHTDNAANGYRAARADPATGVNWDTFWNDSLTGQFVTGAIDVAGNTVSYVIHRLCDTTGAPQLANCTKPPSNNTGGSFSIGGPAITPNSQVYYRITSRVAGPRNTVVYTQTIVAI